MKVLVVWYDYFHYLDGITRGFNQIDGVKAVKFPLEYFKKQSSWIEKTITKAGIKYFEKKYFCKVQEDIKRTCTAECVDAVLFLNADYRGIIDDTLLGFLKENKIKPLLWFVDTIKNKKTCHDRLYLEQFYKIYSFEKSDIEYIEEIFGVPSKYLPLGVDDKIYNNIGITPDKEYDVFFVGAGEEKRYVMLEAVAKYCIEHNRKMLVYGRMWTHRPARHRIKQEIKFKIKYPNLHKVTVNQYLAPEQVAKFYRKSKINLNMLRSEHNGVNPRIFEILATQSFEITEYNEPTAEVFKENDCLKMYHSKNDLVELVDYYLKNDDEREQLAKAGHDLASRKYVISAFLQAIVDDLVDKQ